MTGDLRGCTALVTGSAGGIGSAVVDRLAAEGANVYAHSRAVTPQLQRQWARLADEHGVEISAVAFDMTDSEAMKAAVARIPRQPGVDILVNNAGLAHGGLFEMTPISKVKEVFDANFFCHLELTQLLLRRLNRHGHPSIINVSSIVGMDLAAGNIAYGCSKAALIAATRTLAAELGPRGIRVNSVAPGLTETPMAKHMDPRAAEEMVSRSAMKRYGIPEEVASVVAFLASQDSSFINGQVIRVDGGSA